MGKSRNRQLEPDITPPEPSSQTLFASKDRCTKPALKTACRLVKTALEPVIKDPILTRCTNHALAVSESLLSSKEHHELLFGRRGC